MNEELIIFYSFLVQKLLSNYTEKIFNKEALNFIELRNKSVFLKNFKLGFSVCNVPLLRKTKLLSQVVCVI